MTHIREIKTDRTSKPLAVGSAVLGLAFLVSPVVYATSHHQQFPPYMDTLAALAVGGLLIYNAITSFRR